MINDNMKKVLEALRSGRFKQTKGVLANQDGHCCLGVMCEVAMENGVVLEKESCSDGTDTYFIYDGERSLLPQKVADWVGLRCYTSCFDQNPEIHPSCQLSGCNDQGMTFEQIADLIESQPSRLLK